MTAEQGAKFEALFREHYERVLAYTLRRIGPEEAQDVVAETFLVAWRRLDVLPPDPVPWLLGTARKTLANVRRAGRRRDALRSRLAEQRPVLTAADGDPVAEGSGEEAMASAFERLSDRDQEVLALVAWDGLGGKRAAAVLGCSAATFAVRLHRARRRLLRDLAREEGRSRGSRRSDNPVIEEAT